MIEGPALRAGLSLVDIVDAAFGTFKARPALSFTDCLLLEMARKAGHLPFGTFDRGVGSLDGAERL